MYVKQISVFMENRPGRLAEITKILSENSVDIRAIILPILQILEYSE